MKQYREHLNKLRNNQDFLLGEIEVKNKQIGTLLLDKENKEKARYVLNEVLKITQSNCKEYIEEMVTLALQMVFERDFKFKLELEIKRNKSECRLLVQEGHGDPFVPKEEMGGGMVDLISIILRMIMWSLEQPRTDGVFILDEPLKFLGHGELLNRAIYIIRDISTKLGLQLIIVTHEPELIALADKSWIVTHNGVKSTVTLNEIEKEIVLENNAIIETKPKLVKRRK
jgi:DNA repair exonuclease SbcCD ATPase subunit